jgi:hypothetical protein
MRPTIGRIVHFVNDFANVQELQHHVPAIITRVWSDTCVNLRVFYDGTNDAPEGSSEWKTSVIYQEPGTPRINPDPRTWHWPERAEE